jgi:penicillin V acylase-like amidase (Ntn superfamily)
MKRSRTPLVILLGALLVAPLSEVLACTTFCMTKGQQSFFGKNYDWMVPDGLVMVNKRGVAKTSSIGPEEGRRAKWTSRYGSLTFNQYGREFPSGGMNEPGLAIELMWLDDTQYPGPDGKPVVGCLEWIQYQLDNYATVAEVVRHAGDLRISAGAKIHFLICDKGGSCATVEFLGGKPVVHTGEDLPAKALANHTYEKSLRFREANKGDGAALHGRGSLQRFARAANHADRFAAAKAGDPVAYAFETLADVAQGDYTQWSIVYDLKGGRVHWRTRTNPRVRSAALAAFDFSCGKPVKVLGIDEGEGAVAGLFKDYTPGRNRELVASSFRKTPFLAGTTAAEIDGVVHHPASTSCAVSAR